MARDGRCSPSYRNALNMRPTARSCLATSSLRASISSMMLSCSATIASQKVRERRRNVTRATITQIFQDAFQMTGCRRVSAEVGFLAFAELAFDRFELDFD